MSIPLVSSIVMGCIGNVEPPHKFTEIDKGCFQKQVEVIVHENVTIQNDVVCFRTIVQQFKEYVLIMVIFKDCLPLVASTGYMIQCAFVLYS